MTYPEPSVVETIHKHCVPIQVNTTEDVARPLIERYRQFWTPDIRVLGPDGFDYYHWGGFLPPFEFLPQLLVALGQARLGMNELSSAAATYEEVLRRFPTSRFAAEAQYYLGVARYKESHEAQDLLNNWRRLQSLYPDSIWRMRQSFTEPLPQRAKRREAA